MTVAAGVTPLDLENPFASPTRRREGRIVMTPDMMNLQGESMLLYGSRHYDHDDSLVVLTENLGVQPRQPLHGITSKTKLYRLSSTSAGRCSL